MDDALLRSYLLGTLDQGKQEQIEESLRLGNMTTAQLSIVEDDLIDDYISDQMSVEDRENFERFFLLDPNRAEKFRFGRLLNSFLLQASRKYEQQTDQTQNATGSPTKEQTSIISVRLNKPSKIAAISILAVMLIFASFVLARIESLKNQIESIRQSEEQLRIRIVKIEKNLNGDEESRGSSSQNPSKDSGGVKIVPGSQNEFAIAKWENPINGKEATVSCRVLKIFPPVIR